MRLVRSYLLSAFSLVILWVSGDFIVKWVALYSPSRGIVTRLVTCHTKLLFICLCVPRALARHLSNYGQYGLEFKGSYAVEKVFDLKADMNYAGHVRIRFPVGIQWTIDRIKCDLTVILSRSVVHHGGKKWAKYS